MKITFENYGTTTSVEMSSAAQIEEVMNAVLTCAVGIGFPYKLVLESMIEKYEELKHTIE